jgi:membrane protein YqaA with SNARE-associated domain
MSLFSSVYIGLFFSSFLAATIIPFSSEAVLLATIYAGGKPVLSIIIATLGNWLGGITSYYLGYFSKWEWLSKYFRVSKESILKTQNKINKFGPIIAFLCWLPFVGDVLAIGLGYFRINYVSTILYMLLGKFLRYVGWYYLLFEIF